MKILTFFLEEVPMRGATNNATQGNTYRLSYVVCLERESATDRCGAAWLYEVLQARLTGVRLPPLGSIYDPFHKLDAGFIDLCPQILPGTCGEYDCFSYAHDYEAPKLLTKEEEAALNNIHGTQGNTVWYRIVVNYKFYENPCSPLWNYRQTPLPRQVDARDKIFMKAFRQDIASDCPTTGICFGDDKPHQLVQSVCTRTDPDDFETQLLLPGKCVRYPINTAGDIMEGYPPDTNYDVRWEFTIRRPSLASGVPGTGVLPSDYPFDSTKKGQINAFPIFIEIPRFKLNHFLPEHTLRYETVYSSGVVTFCTETGQNLNVMTYVFTERSCGWPESILNEGIRECVRENCQDAGGTTINWTPKEIDKSQSVPLDLSEGKSVYNEGDECSKASVERYFLKYRDLSFDMADTRFGTNEIMFPGPYQPQP